MLDARADAAAITQGMLDAAAAQNAPTLVWIVVFLVLTALHAAGTALVKGGVCAPLAKDPVLAGHFLPQLIGFIVFAVYGTRVWLFDAIPFDEGASVGVYFEPGETLALLMIGFQMYELAATVASERLRGNAYEMVVHHGITLLLASLGYCFRAYLYFGAFFFGVSEVSSVPLAFVDLFKQFPALRKAYPAANEAARMTFGVAFLAIRGLYWPFVSFFFWKSSLAALAADAYEPRAVIYTFFAANVVLTLMQWYWASLIVAAMVKKAKGAEGDGEASASDYELHQGLVHVETS